MTVLVIVDQVQNAGAAAALVYRRDDVARAAGSALVFVVSSSIVLFGVAQILSPLVADLFRTPELTNVLRAMSFLLLTRAIGAIPLALLERNIDFRSLSVCELTGALGQAGISLGLAVSGFGVWSIVLGQIAGSTLQSALAWAVTPLHPDPRKASLGAVRGARSVRPLRERYQYPEHCQQHGRQRRHRAGARGDGARLLRGRLPAGRLPQHDHRPHRRSRHVPGVLAASGRACALSPRVHPEPAADRRAGATGQRDHPRVCGADRSRALRRQVGTGHHPAWILAAYGLVKSFTSPAGEVFKGAGRPELGSRSAHCTSHSSCPSSSSSCARTNRGRRPRHAGRHHRVRDREARPRTSPAARQCRRAGARACSVVPLLGSSLRDPTPAHVGH